MRGIETGGQYVDIDQVFERLSPEQATGCVAAKPGEQFVALAVGRFAADEPAFDAVSLLENVLDMLGVFDARREDQHRLAILRVGDDLLAGRFDELVLVHQLFELVGHELAGADVQLFRVGLLSAGLGHQRAEISVADEFPHADLEADGVEDVLRPADHARFQAEWRGRKTDGSHPRIDHLGIGQELPIHPFAVRRDQVRLVDNDQVEGVQFAGPLVDRLDAGDDHRLARYRDASGRRSRRRT